MKVCHIDIVTTAIKKIYRVSNMITYLLHICVFDQVAFITQ